jgi:hypothetical protein
MKNILLLENYYSPDELTDQLGLFIQYYNNERYHEALQNLTPADVYYGRDRDILSRLKRIRYYWASQFFADTIQVSAIKTNQQLTFNK